MVGSEYRVFASLSQSVGLSIPFTGLSVGEVFDRFRQGLDKSRIIFIIVLEEVDALIKDRGDSFMYELTRINETLHNSKVSIIGISNDLRLKEFLDPASLVPLVKKNLSLDPTTQLNSATSSERSKLSFQDGVLSDSALSICSTLAAAEHGDARRALDLLRVAGEVAERQGSKAITEEHVRQAEKHIEHNRVIDALKNLTLHSKLVLLSVYHLNKSNASTGEIYDVYNELCGEFGAGLLTQRRLGTLINELDSMGLVN
jgi:cell division control protein 6